VVETPEEKEARMNRLQKLLSPESHEINFEELYALGK
jgi:hypothetical protein